MTNDTPSATDAAAADLDRSIAAVATIKAKHASITAQLSEAKIEYSNISLLAEFEPDFEVRRDQLRTIIETFQHRLVELSAAETAARGMVEQARKRSLKAREVSDRLKAINHWDTGELLAEQLHEVLETAGNLYARMVDELDQASVAISPHVSQTGSVYRAPDLIEAIKVILQAAGGPNLGGEMRKIGFSHRDAPPSLGGFLALHLAKPRKRLEFDLGPLNPQGETDASKDAA
jgi:hypothetical protein